MVRYIRGVRIFPPRPKTKHERWQIAHDIVEGKSIKQAAIDNKRSYSGAHKVYLFDIKVEVKLTVKMSHPDQLEFTF